MIRLYVGPNQPLSEGLAFPLNADQAHYLLHVMRKGQNDKVLAFNGRDGEWLCALETVTKKGVILRSETQVKTQVATRGPILVQALIKRARLESIIEKATELGAAHIQLLVTRRTVGDHTNVARLQAIAIEAAEQTERLDVPDILAPIKFEAFLKSRDEGLVFYGDENSTHADFVPTPPFLAALKGAKSEGSAFLLVGPEGGFDDQERSLLQGHERCLGVNLGPRILRADTAAFAMLSLYQAVLGDWS